MLTIIKNVVLFFQSWLKISTVKLYAKFAIIEIYLQKKRALITHFNSTPMGLKDLVKLYNQKMRRASLQNQNLIGDNTQRE